MRWRWIFPFGLVGAVLVALQVCGPQEFKERSSRDHVRPPLANGEGGGADESLVQAGKPRTDRARDEIALDERDARLAGAIVNLIRRCHNGAIDPSGLKSALLDALAANRPRLAGLYAYAYGVVASTRRTPAFIRSLNAAPHPVLSMLALGLQSRRESAVWEREEAIKAVSGVLLSRTLNASYADWARQFFLAELGEQAVRVASGPNSGGTAVQRLDIELQRNALTLLTRDVPRTDGESFVPILLSDRVASGDRTSLILTLFSRPSGKEWANTALLRVASDSADRTVRSTALRQLGEPLDPSQQQMLVALATAESDPEFVTQAVDSMRMTNTRPGAVLADLFRRHDHEGVRLAVGRLAVSTAKTFDAPENQAVFLHIVRERDGALLTRLLGRVQHRKFLKSPVPALALDAMRVGLASPDPAVVRETLLAIQAQSVVDLRDDVRKFSEDNTHDFRDLVARVLQSLDDR